METDKLQDLKNRGTWRVKSNRHGWMYGSLCPWRKGIDFMLNVETPYSVKEEELNTIGQYTGFKDKNGTEIYEGDILKFYDDIYFIAEVCYSENTGAFMIEEHPSDGNLEYLGGQDTTWSLVIGNIHDNPELLEKAERGDLIK